MRRSQVVALATTVALLLGLPGCALVKPRRVAVVERVTIRKTLAPGERVPAAGDGAAGGSTGSALNALGPSRDRQVSSDGDGGIAAGSIKIGTINIVEGALRDIGLPIVKTTQAYIEDINARGGINGRRLELVSYSACETCADQALAAATRLVERDHVFALVNTFSLSYAFEPVIPYLEKHGVPLIQGMSQSQLEPLGPMNYFFATHLGKGERLYAQWLAKIIGERGIAKKVAIGYMNNPQAKRKKDGVRASLARRGIDVVDEELIEENEDAVTHMDAAVSRMRMSGATAVFLASNVLLPFAAQAAKRQGWSPVWVANADWAQLAIDSCGGACEGAYSDTSGWAFPDTKTAQMARFKRVMAAYYPSGKIEALTVGAGTGMVVFEDLMRRMGSTPTRAGLLEHLEGLRGYETGLTPPITVNAGDHWGISGAQMLQVRGGKWVRVTDWLLMD
ncbi:MAG: ABC transporter substrate-binding protein [Actinomycetota bacterium]